MREQRPQHADSPPPDRHGVGAPKEDFRRNIKPEGAECVHGIHAEPGLNSATFCNFLRSASRHFSLLTPGCALLLRAHRGEFAEDFAAMVTLSDAAGYLASTMVLLTFMTKDMRLLRVLAIGSNVAFATYGLMVWLPPVFCLHLLLLPINALRLRELLTAQSSRLPVARPRPFDQRWPLLRKRAAGAAWRPPQPMRSKSA